MKIELGGYRNRHSRGSKIKRLLWEIVYVCFVRPTPRWAMHGWRKCWLLLFGAVIGKGVRIQGGAEVWQPWRLRIGDSSWIDDGVKLYTADDIVIGSNAVISEGAFICTATHDITSEAFELKTAPVKIGDMAWIASRAILLPGVTIGEGAVVGAGAVVTKDVEPWTVVGGNPAKVISKRAVRIEGK